MNNQKTYNEMMAHLDAIAETIPEKQAERAAAAIRKAETYNEAFWDTMHTGMPHNVLKEGSDGSGGYLVPDTYEDRLVKALTNKNVLRQISNVITTKNSMHIPVAEGVDCADWVPEGTPFQFMDAEFGEVILPVRSAKCVMRCFHGIPHLLPGCRQRTPLSSPRCFPMSIPFR